MRVFSLDKTAHNLIAAWGPVSRVVMFVLLISMGFLASASESFAQTYRFSRVTVEGNQQIDAASIQGFARIARNRAISADELSQAYQRVAATGLFRELDFVPRGNTLVIRVRENPILNIVNFEGNRRIDNEALARIAQSRSGGIYSPAQAEADAIAIAEAYAQEGRLAARVTPRLIERAGGRVDLAFEIVEGAVAEVERISFVGNRSFSDRRLRSVVETAQTGPFRLIMRVDNYNPARVEMDRGLLLDFYRSQGFIDAQVSSALTELSRERDGVFVTFTLREGPRYRIASASVVSEVPGVDAERYQREMRLRLGTYYSPTTIDSNIQRLERLAAAEGHRFVRAEPRITRNEREGTLDVVFAMVRGERVFIERIDIQGNATTLDRVVRRQFRVAEGDPLNPREIREAADRIRALNYFSNVAVAPRGGSTPDQAIVGVELEETTTGSLSLGGSYSANDGAGLAISYSETNFLGRGQSVSLSFNTLIDSRSLEFNFVEPALLGRDLRFGLMARYGVSTGQLGNYDTRLMRVSPSLSFPIADYTRLEGRYTLSYDSILNVDAASSARIQADEAMGDVLTSSIGYTITRDTRRGGPDPDRGYVLRLSQDAAGIGGDRRWLRTTAMAGYRQTFLSGDVTFRAEVEGGAMAHFSGDSRINERFDVRGMMRGFRPGGIGPRDLGVANEDALGGNYYAVARFELDFPVGIPREYGIGAGVFLDVGTLWGLDNPGGVDDNQYIRAAAGIAILWDTPVGPLRFNFSRPLRSQAYDRIQNFDFAVSTRF